MNINSERTMIPQSLNEDDADIKCVMPQTLRIVSYLFLICVFFFSVGGNLLVFISVYRKRSLRRKASLFLLNLMTCDFFSALFAIPIEIVYILGKDEWLIGRAGYYFAMGNFYWFLTMSFLNITAVTLERFASIKYPFKYQRWITNKKIAVIIVAIWLYSISISILLASTVDPNEYDFLIADKYYYPFLTLHVFVPTVIVTVAYLKLLSIARRQAKMINAHANDSRKDSSSRHFSGSVRRNTKAVKTVAVFFLILVSVWLPFCVIQFLNFSAISFCSWDLADTLSVCVTYTNGALNVFIYWWSDEDFRRGLREMMTCA